jgi:hypothetical protein
MAPNEKAELRVPTAIGWRGSMGTGRGDALHVDMMLFLTSVCIFLDT